MLVCLKLHFSSDMDYVRGRRELTPPCDRLLTKVAVCVYICAVASETISFVVLLKWTCSSNRSILNICHVHLPK